MIVRYALRCEGCGTITMLRLGIGGEDVQTFEFECGQCSQEIRGRLFLDQARGDVGKLETEGATQDSWETLPVRFTDYPHVITIHPTFPTVQSTNIGRAFSPFMAAVGRHGLAVITERIGRSAQFARGKETRAQLARVVRSYQKGQWKAFDDCVRELLRREDGVTAEEREQALYDVVDPYLAPLVASQANDNLFGYFKHIASRLAHEHADAICTAVKDLDRVGILTDVQNSALESALRLVELTDEFAPLLVEWDAENPDSALPPDLVVPGKARFHDVKSLYVDAYETSARGLTIVLALINLMKRGDANHFTPHPVFARGKNKPFAKSLADFAGQAHGGKLPMLCEEPRFEAWLAGTLDAQLRNAIGHNSVRHRADLGEVRYATNRQATNWKRISYAEFLHRILRTVVRAHQMGHLTKVIHESPAALHGDI